jgi:hypothetical protein
MKLSDKYVYVVRSNAKRKGLRRAKTRGASLSRSNGRESAFRRLALELGLDNARKLLADTMRKVAALIGGR